MKRLKFNINIIYVLFPILIVVAKVIRYTLMKNVLVDNGIGHNWIYLITSSLSNKEILSYTIAAGANGKSILLYRFINFLNINNYVDFEIFISVIFNIILFIIIFRKEKVLLNFWQLIFIAMSIIVLNIFDFCLAKEPIQMLFFIFIYFVLINKKASKSKKMLYMALTLIFAAISFRIYYLLICMYTIATYVFFEYFFKKKENIKLRYIIIFLICIGLSYFIILNVLKVVSYKNFLELLRVRSREADARTQFRNIFNSENLVLFSVNYVLMFLRMLVPVELLTLGPKYVIYALYQIIITTYIAKYMLNLRKNSDNVNLALYLYVGFLFGSATFEPDFGSWVRHEAILFPIFLVIMNYNNKEKIIDGK